MKILVWMDESTSKHNSEAEVAEIIGTVLESVAAKVLRVTVAIRDTNGPKGGANNLSRLTAHLITGDIIVLSEHAATVVESVNNAANRLQTAICKALQRQQLHRNRNSLAESEAVYAID